MRRFGRDNYWRKREEWEVFCGEGHILYVLTVYGCIPTKDGVVSEGQTKGENVR